VVRTRPTVTALVLDDAAEHVLLLWRHRFITDAWGWEVPGGWVDDDEAPPDAIAREVEDETGWRAAPMRKLGRWFSMPGICDAHCTLYRADGATFIGSPTDESESGGSHGCPSPTSPSRRRSTDHRRRHADRALLRTGPPGIAYGTPWWVTPARFVHRF
jgi:hypothetical protein